MTNLAGFGGPHHSMYQIVSLPYTENSAELFVALRSLPGAIWFDSGKPGSGYGRYDIMTAAPSATLEATTNGIQLHNGDQNIANPSSGKTVTHSSAFAAARELLHSLPQLPTDIAEFPFVGGLAGFFGYDLGKSVEQVATANPAIANLPQMRLGLYHWSLIVDHHQQKTRLIFLDSCPATTVEAVQSKLSEPATTDTFKLLKPFEASMTESEYQQALEQIQRYILAGDCYQVNFAQHFAAPYEGDPLAAYLKLRAALPSPFSAYMDWGDQAVLSLSPERFLEVANSGAIETKPIKGTLRRGTDIESDQANAKQLLGSTKDRAENLMIVDLLRNDLGKSARPGSISVPKLFALESFPNVHHLVSTVIGDLADNKDALDLLEGCFPGGSITGAPKRRAMEIIEELEQYQRSLYCGSVGYISRCGRMDTSIAIRTLLADKGQLHCWGGGGIVADSDAAAEYQESIDKVALLMRTLSEVQG